MPKKQAEGVEGPRKVYEIRLKPGHPTGEYRRAGLTFTVSSPVRLDELPDVVRDDPWLIVTEVPAGN